MELICEKYNEKVSGENPLCSHPKEYCKFRPACIVNFMGEEAGSSEPGELTNKGDDMPTLRFDKGEGLLPAIVQDHETKEVLMLAYINDLAWQKTLETGRA
ncbi:MAG: hypothetical protein R3297_04235, partial [Desulfobulbales bacterium]|nr:hypothetical protein [Desulfobulbales bacterium]